MKEIYLDTKVLLRFYIDDKLPKQKEKEIENLYKGIFEKGLVVRSNLLVISEFCYVSESLYKRNKKEITEDLLIILSQPNFKLEEKPEVKKALKTYAEKNIDFEDAYIYTDMLSRDIENIYTFDKKHFSKLKGISVI